MKKYIILITLCFLFSCSIQCRIESRDSLDNMDKAEEQLTTIENPELIDASQ